MTPLRFLVLATFLTLVPVTLPVPALAELVMRAHGGTRFEAHLFMAVNMIAGMAAVPAVLVLVRRRPGLRRWLFGLLLLDAVLFAGMGLARSLGQLLALRALDGAAHLPAVTLLMMGASRLGERRRGAVLGSVAGSIMVGVAVGAPLGGVLISRGPRAVYLAGAVLLAAAALVAAAARGVPAAPAGAGGAAGAAGASRYAWDRRRAHAWMPLVLGFADRFTVGVFSSTFTLYLGEVVRLSPAQRGLLVSLFMLPFAALCWPVGRLVDRVGWLAPLVAGTVGFGLVYAAYGAVPPGLLPAAMVLSGVLSAMMYAPNLVVVAEMARRGAGEGLFGALQMAGSLGFLVGPIAGGLLVEVSRLMGGAVAYRAIFAGVGAATALLGLVALAALRPLARAWAAPAAD